MPELERLVQAAAALGLTLFPSSCGVRHLPPEMAGRWTLADVLDASWSRYTPDEVEEYLASRRAIGELIAGAEAFLGGGPLGAAGGLTHHG